MWGKRIAARKYQVCFTCEDHTVQWLSHVRPSSPGSYRGTRLQPAYTCSTCGEIQLG